MRGLHGAADLDSGSGSGEFVVLSHATEDFSEVFIHLSREMPELYSCYVIWILQLDATNSGRKGHQCVMSLV